MESQSAKFARSFSFSGVGWLKAYMFGVGKALQEHRLQDGARFIGTSAGSLVATGLVLDWDFEAVRSTILNVCVPTAHSGPLGMFKMRPNLDNAIDWHGNLHRFEQLNANPDRLAIVYSSLSRMKSRRARVFTSPEHVKQSIIASCCATPFAGRPFKLNGEWVMDGGLFDNQPLFDDGETIRVTPFIIAGGEIKPSMYVPPWWALYPPSQRDISWIFDLGYEDGLRWIAKKTGKDISIPNVAGKSFQPWLTTIGRVIGYRTIDSFIHQCYSATSPKHPHAPIVALIPLFVTIAQLMLTSDPGATYLVLVAFILLVAFSLLQLVKLSACAPFNFSEVSAGDNCSVEYAGCE
ncbi:TPA: hypothetical protein N0F65_008414 [Lagenidium giganteum]|uniref:PNPLA domain-containing protein n=1 Tax=Lagenidium giganteum TaxID=4803 RepID=A0AAV2Z0J1_9STRA|nr:TPA: hypothetical protein N0F65_008414 [Lagenidium giganteum]